MSKVVIYGQDQRVAEWVRARVDATGEFVCAKAIGLEEDGELIAGVVFDDYKETSISMHVAAAPGKRWMTRDFLFRCFAYPFLQCGVNRINGLVPESNLVAQRFDEHLGFKREGLVRKACKDGGNLILYGMLREECRFLEIKK
jgi:RimJ/RimL family protein N-acetyltransferase